MQRSGCLSITFWIIASSLLAACASTSGSQAEPPDLPNEYSEQLAMLPLDRKLHMQKSLENFFDGIREPIVRQRARELEASNPLLQSLKPVEQSHWFEDLFETLVGAQLMARSNSFRSYQNYACLEAYLRPLASNPLPETSALISLDEFMRAGPRIPDENTYTGQIRLFCGRRSINSLQGVQPAVVAKIYLGLRYNPVLQKWILLQASREADIILRSYRELLQ